VLIAAVTVGLASLFTSASPDGLQKIATDLGFISKSASAPFQLFAGYKIFGLTGSLGTLVAGLLGVFVVIAVIILLNRIASKRRGS
jgi:hypothetical protein